MTILTRPHKLCWSAAIAFAALLGGKLPAQAANFNFTYAPDTTLEQMLSFEMAGLYWSNYLADDVTINLLIETTDHLPDNVIGGALPGLKSKQKFEHLLKGKKYLEKDITSDEDQIAFDHIQTKKDQRKFYAYSDQRDYKRDEIKDITLTRANAKALGLINGDDSKLDGYILMRNLTDLSLDWNYDVLDPDVPVNSLDFLSVALHEIGHTLGFISGVDDPMWLGVVEESTQRDKKIGKNKMEAATLLDLFRLSDKSVRDYGGVPDLTISDDNKFFSIDGGQTNLAAFASGEAVYLGADGYQASHWQKQEIPLGIMDPALSAGQRRTISDLDKLAFDVIGWDLSPSQAINLTDLNTLAKAQLAQKMGVTLEWMEANPIAAALLLAPDWANTNGKGDDRGKQLQDMFRDSKVYEWGYSGFWWGWSGFWQERDDDDEFSLWQHMAWQTVQTSSAQTQTAAASVPEPTTNAGLLSLAWLGLGGLLKRRRNAVGAAHHR